MIANKIFQPFLPQDQQGKALDWIVQNFLGVSVSYHIVKAYGGELKVKTKPG